MKKILEILKKEKLIIYALVMVILFPYVQVLNESANDIEQYTVHEHEKIEATTEESTNTRGTIINVPIDARPISRSNFEYLVKTAGYEYIEIGNENSLDKMDTNGKYTAGNSQAIRDELATKISSYNKENTTVIINTSSYFFGGLIATRNHDAYSESEITKKIDDLTTLIENNQAPKYYIIITIPRTLPDERACVIGGDPELKWDNKCIHCKCTICGKSEEKKCKCNEDNCECDGCEGFKGLGYYYKNEEFTTSFGEAVLDYQYLEYYQKEKNIEDSQLPEYVQTFKSEFYAEYKEYLDKYLAMYEGAYMYIEKLIDLKNEYGDKIELIGIGQDDFKISNFVQGHAGTEGNDFNYIEIVEINEYATILKKYGSTRYITKKIESKIEEVKKFTKDFKIHMIPGIDEIHHMILARDLVEKTQIGIQYEYLDPITGIYEGITEDNWNLIATYDVKTVWDNLMEREAFINGTFSEDANNIVVNTYLVKFSPENMTVGNAKIAAENIYKNTNKTAVIGVEATTGFDENLLTELANQGNIYDLIYCSAWNTVGNSTGIGLASIAVGAITEYEIKNPEKSIKQIPIKDRITNYMKYKLITLLEGRSI